MGYDDKPACIPSPVIEEIRRRVKEIQREDPFGLGQFRRGDRVRITEGLFRGLWRHVRHSLGGGECERGSLSSSWGAWRQPSWTFDTSKRPHPALS